MNAFGGSGDAADGVESPPFPPTSATSQALYRYLAQLRAWVVGQQSVLRGLVPASFSERLLDPPELSRETIWEQVSVADQWTVHQWMQDVRKNWDAILRQHEDAWDTRLALKRRYAVLLSAMHLLAEAFITHEVRELREQQTAELALQQVQQQVNIVLFPMGQPPSDPDDPRPAGPTDTAPTDEEWFNSGE